MTEEIKLNIYQRINKVREAVSYIQKDAAVQGYKAISHDMVTSEVRPHLIKHGVLIVPRQMSGELRDTPKITQKNTPITVFIASYEIDFVNIDDPVDRVTVPIMATAEDQGDKGPGKAVSYATKTAMLKLFSIETGESDESRQEQKPKEITKEQIDKIKALMVEVKADEKAFLKFFKITTIEAIPYEAYQKAVNMLESKRKPAERQTGEDG